MKQRGQRWGKGRPVVDNIEVETGGETLSFAPGETLIWNGTEFVAGVV